MTLDQYQLCPCGSGKKIKFCCSKDLLHDLDRISRMIEGEQRLAAVEKIDSLLEKHPDKPSLIMMKAQLQMQMNEIEKARELIDRLQEVAPRNPSAIAMKAIFAIGIEHNVTHAIHYLQDALETLDGNVTAAIQEAVVVVVTTLYRIGRPAASRGHLQLLLSMTNSDDERALQILRRMNQDRQVPLLLREALTLHACPENVTWRIEFNVAMREVYRGRWRRGAQQLHAMSIRILDAPAILFNLGVLQTWLANDKDAAYTFRQYARIRDVPLDDRIHAMALAEAIDTLAGKYRVDLLEVTYEVDKIDTLMERCLANRQLVKTEVDPSNVPEGQPAPRAVYQVYDRPLLTGSEESEFKIDAVPRLMGGLMIFGKETDRPARLVIQTLRSRVGDLAKQAAELYDGELPEPKGEEVVTRVNWLVADVMPEGRLPPTMTPAEQTLALRQLQSHAIRERLLVTANPVLEEKTPKEVAESGKESEKLTLQGMLLNLELLAQDNNWEVDFRQLRQELGLPVLEPIAAEGLDIERLPVHRLNRVDITKLDDEQLIFAYRRAYVFSAVQSLRRLAEEVISRPTLDDKIDKVEAYDILSDVATSTDEALEYLDKARKLATSEGESPAAWLLDEMEIRLLRGEGDKFVQLLKEIQTRYMNEPGISNALLDLLARYGLVTPDGRLRMGGPRESAAEPEPAAAAATGLWTPDGGTDAGSGEAQGESKLWIPGMD